MTPVNIIKSSEAKVLLKDEMYYNELEMILSSCMFIDSYDLKTKIMYKDFDYLLIVKSKKNSINQYVCPGVFGASYMLSPIHIAGDEAILKNVPIGGVFSPCDISSIKEIAEEFNRSSIYTHIITNIIILDEIAPSNIEFKSELSILKIHEAYQKYTNENRDVCIILDVLLNSRIVLDDIYKRTQIINTDAYLIILKERGLNIYYYSIYNLFSSEPLKLLYIGTDMNLHSSTILITTLNFNKTEKDLLENIYMLNNKFQAIKIIDIIKL